MTKPQATAHLSTYVLQGGTILTGSGARAVAVEFPHDLVCYQTNSLHLVETPADLIALGVPASEVARAMKAKSPRLQSADVSAAAYGGRWVDRGYY